MYSNYGTYGTYGSDSLISSNTAGAGVLAAVVAIWGIALVVCLAIAIVQIIARWKMFEKAGEAGWKAIIPVYNEVVLCQIAGVNPWWIAIVFGPMLFAWIPFIGAIFALFATVAAFYFNILLSVSITNAFGKDTNKTGWALFYSAFPFICDLILGFGKSKYVKKDPMKDFIFKK